MIKIEHESNIFAEKRRRTQAGKPALRRRVSFLQKKRISEPSEGAERIRYVDFGR
jgi:hypothetical protein